MDCVANASCLLCPPCRHVTAALRSLLETSGVKQGLTSFTRYDSSPAALQHQQVQGKNRRKQQTNASKLDSKKKRKWSASDSYDEDDDVEWTPAGVSQWNLFASGWETS